MPIDQVLDILDKMIKGGLSDIMVEPDMSVINRDLDKAVQAYYIRRNLDGLR